MLGHLVETLSGISYSDYMLNRVFAPLGMSRSRILPAGMDLQSRATPYTYANDGDVAAVELRDPAWTSSYRLARPFRSNGTDPCPGAHPGTRTQDWEPVLWRHSGSDPGISTLVAFRPRDRRGAVILMNSGGGVPIMAAEIPLGVLAEQPEPKCPTTRGSALISG